MPGTEKDSGNLTKSAIEHKTLVIAVELQTCVKRLRFLMGMVQEPPGSATVGTAKPTALRSFRMFLVTKNPESAGLSPVIWVVSFLCFEADF